MDQSMQIGSAISFIPAIDRELWVEIGMALKSELGDSGFDIGIGGAAKHSRTIQNQLKACGKASSLAVASR